MHVHVGDVQVESPENLNENLNMNMSSPSSSPGMSPAPGSPKSRNANANVMMESKLSYYYQDAPVPMAMSGVRVGMVHRLDIPMIDKIQQQQQLQQRQRQRPQQDGEEFSSSRDTKAQRVIAISQGTVTPSLLGPIEFNFFIYR